MFCTTPTEGGHSNYCSSNKILAASSVVALISIVALGIIFAAADPLTHSQNMTFLYADVALGGVAILGIVLSSASKIRHCQKSSNTSSVPISFDPLTSYEETQSIPSAPSIKKGKSTFFDPPAFNVEKLKKAVSSELNNIISGKPTKKITKHPGKHMYVFEHADFPNVVIKLPQPQHAQEMLESLTICQGILRDHPEIRHCFIPPAREVMLSANYTMFVMEKVRGSISSAQSQEESEKAFEKFPSSAELQHKWETFFMDAAQFICLTGYWDANWKNILLIDEAFAFVDFENVSPTRKHQCTGLAGLLKMAPPECIESILAVAAENDISEHEICAELGVKDIETFKTLRHDYLALRSQVRKWHSANHITNPSHPLNIERWNENSLENRILKQLEAQNKKNLCNPHLRGSLIEQRKMCWQPASDLQFSKEAFNKALENLKASGNICAWKAEGGEEDIPFTYTIFF